MQNRFPVDLFNTARISKQNKIEQLKIYKWVRIGCQDAKSSNSGCKHCSWYHDVYSPRDLVDDSSFTLSYV